MKLLYAGIRVRDLDRSIGFYTKALGMEVVQRGRMEHGGEFVELKSPGSAQRLELNWYPRDNEYYTEYKNGEELDHLGFWVGDVEKELERLTRKGAEVAVEPFVNGRTELAFVKDPDGVWIELQGRAKRPRARRGTG